MESKVYILRGHVVEQADGGLVRHVVLDFSGKVCMRGNCCVEEGGNHDCR